MARRGSVGPGRRGHGRDEPGPERRALEARTMRSVTMAIGGGLALALASGPSLAAVAPDAVVEALDAPEVSGGGELTVQLAPDMFEGETLRTWVEERGLEALAGRDPLAPGDRIVVEVEGTPLDYVLRVSAIRRGEALPGEGEPLECKCTTNQLLASVGEKVDQAVSRLEHAASIEREQARRERLAQEKAAQAERARRAQLREQEQRAALAAEPYRPRPIGVAGGVAIGAGGAMLITGVALAVVGQGRPTRNDLVLPRDLRPAGFTLLGVGLGALATGVGLLVVDVLRCHEDRVACGRRGPVIERARGPRRWRMAWR